MWEISERDMQKLTHNVRSKGFDRIRVARILRPHTVSIKYKGKYCVGQATRLQPNTESALSCQEWIICIPMLGATIKRGLIRLI